MDAHATHPSAPPLTSPAAGAAAFDGLIPYDGSVVSYFPQKSHSGEPVRTAPGPQLVHWLSTPVPGVPDRGGRRNALGRRGTPFRRRIPHVNRALVGGVGKIPRRGPKAA